MAKQLVLRVYGEEKHPIDLGDRNREIRTTVRSREAFFGLEEFYVGFSTGPSIVNGRNKEERVIEFYYREEAGKERLGRLSATINSERDLRCKAEFIEREESK